MSVNQLAYHYGSGRESPWAVLVIGDPRDSAVRRDIKPNDSFDCPRGVAAIEQNDRDGAVHFAECQLPRLPHTLVNPKVARIGEVARESIGHEQPGIGADQFAQPVPIAPIETFDVQTKNLLVLGGRGTWPCRSVLRRGQFRP